MCVLLQWKSLKMYVTQLQNMYRILGASNIHNLAPTAVKHTCFIDPGRIAVPNAHIMLIHMWQFPRFQETETKAEHKKLSKRWAGFRAVRLYL